MPCTFNLNKTVINVERNQKPCKNVRRHVHNINIISIIEDLIPVLHYV